MTRSPTAAIDRSTAAKSCTGNRSETPPTAAGSWSGTAAERRRRASRSGHRGLPQLVLGQRVLVRLQGHKVGIDADPGVGVLQPRLHLGGSIASTANGLASTPGCTWVGGSP